MVDLCKIPLSFVCPNDKEAIAKFQAPGGSLKVVDDLQVLVENPQNYPGIYIQGRKEEGISLFSLPYAAKNDLEEQLKNNLEVDFSKVKKETTLNEIYSQNEKDDINIDYNASGFLVDTSVGPAVFTNMHVAIHSSSNLEKKAILDSKNDIALFPLDETYIESGDKLTKIPVTKLSNDELNGSKVSLAGPAFRNFFEISGEATLITPSVIKALKLKEELLGHFIVAVDTENEIDKREFKGLSGAPFLNSQKQVVGIIHSSQAFQMTNSETNEVLKNWNALFFSGPEALKETISKHEQKIKRFDKLEYPKK